MDLIENYLLCLFDGTGGYEIDERNHMDGADFAIHFHNSAYFNAFLKSIPIGESTGGKFISLKKAVIDVSYSENTVVVDPIGIVYY